jgi:hypothetical protein
MLQQAWAPSQTQIKFKNGRPNPTFYQKIIQFPFFYILYFFGIFFFFSFLLGKMNCNLPVVLEDVMGALGAGAGAGAEVLAAHCRFKEPGKCNNRIKSYSICSDEFWRICWWI